MSMGFVLMPASEEIPDHRHGNTSRARQAHRPRSRLNPGNGGAETLRARMHPIDIFAWIVLAVLAAILIAIFVALGMLPGLIARKRGHPWAEA